MASISAQTVQRILQSHHLKPWRHQLWLNPKAARDAAFAASVLNVCGLYTRDVLPFEMVICVDEKTSLQPRTRQSDEAGKARLAGARRA